MNGAKRICAVAFVVALASITTSPAFGAKVGLADAIARTRADIERTRAEIVKRRKAVADARLALTRRERALQADVRKKRADLSRTERAREKDDLTREELAMNAARLEKELQTIRPLLVNLRRDAELRLDLVDASTAQDELEKLDASLGAVGGKYEKLPGTTSSLLSFLTRHMEPGIGVRRTPGKAIDTEGREVDGTFVRIGAMQILFASHDATASSGIVRLESGSVQPHVWPIEDPEVQVAIGRSAKGGEALVPVDVTGGSALRSGGAQLTLLDQIKAGGVVMYPILAIAVVCLIVGLLKSIQLFRIRTDFDTPLTTLLTMLRERREEEAAAFARRAAPPLRRLMEEGVAHREASRESLEEMMHEAILIEVPPLERYLPFLTVGAAVSPLLGLLGTVTGMIHTFRLIAVFGTGDPRLLSGGISEALITTEAGLIVAIPLLLWHALLSRRVRAVSEGLEKSAVSFINTLKTRQSDAGNDGKNEPGGPSS